MSEYYNYGLTPEQVKEVLELGLTPKQFEHVRRDYWTPYGLSTKEKRDHVIEIFKKRKTEGLSIPKPYENGSLSDHESSLFFGITGAIGALLFNGGWILSAAILGKMVNNITKDSIKNAKEYDKFVEEWKRRNQ